MTSFIIHQHHHYGWTTDTVEAADTENAMILNILKYHMFLEKRYSGNYLIEFKPALYGDCYRYCVRWANDQPKIDHVGPPMYEGDTWFGDLIRVGAPEDCRRCGGTGSNHYYSWKQCWACGDQEKDGRGTGKKIDD